MLRCRCEVKRPRATIHTARGAWLGWFDAFPLWVAREHDGGDGMKFIHGPSRRDVLRGIGVGGVMLATGACAPALWRRPRVAGAAPPGQLHLQFGSDAGREMVASWATPEAVFRPRLRLGTPEGGVGVTIPAATRADVGAQAGTRDL